MDINMTLRERFINSLEQKNVDRVPYWYLWFGARNAVLEKMGANLKDIYYSAGNCTGPDSCQRNVLS